MVPGTIAGLVVVAGLFWVLWRAVGSRGFSLSRALMPIRSFEGDNVGRLLSLLTIATVIVTTDVVPPQALVAAGVGALLAVALGAAIAPRLTDRLLTVAGILLALASTFRDHGPGVAVAVLMMALLGLWITGLLRGFRF